MHRLSHPYTYSLPRTLRTSRLFRGTSWFHVPLHILFIFMQQLMSHIFVLSYLSILYAPCFLRKLISVPRHIAPLSLVDLSCNYLVLSVDSCSSPTWIRTHSSTLLCTRDSRRLLYVQSHQILSKWPSSSHDGNIPCRIRSDSCIRSCGTIAWGWWTTVPFLVSCRI